MLDQKIDKKFGGVENNIDNIADWSINVINAWRTKRKASHVAQDSTSSAVPASSATPAAASASSAGPVAPSASSVVPAAAETTGVIENLAAVLEKEESERIAVEGGFIGLKKFGFRRLQTGGLDTEKKDTEKKGRHRGHREEGHRV